MKALLFCLSAALVFAASPDNFIEQNIGLTSSLTLAQLRTRIGAKTESSRQIANLHVQGQIDRIYTLSDGAGTEVEAYVTAPGQVLIERVKVTATNRRLPAGLQIGRSSTADVVAAIGGNGEVEKREGGTAARYFNTEQTANALLWFEHDRLAGVEWHYDVD